MAKKDIRYDGLKSVVMLNDQYQKDQTQEVFEYNQALFNEQFELLGNVYTIEEELVRGTQIFTPIRASVNTIRSLNSKTDIVDDYRSLLFKNLKYDAWLGKRYRFANNIWITVNINSINTVANHSVVQRCNNVLRWIDNDGYLYEEPCIINSNISRTTTEQGTHIEVIDGELNVILQYNDITNKIGINQKFVIGGQTYIVKMIDKGRRMATFDENSVGLITLYLDVVVSSTDDDIDKIINDNNNDNDDSVLNGVVITPNIRDLTCYPPYNIGVFNVYKYSNGVKLDDKFTFEFYDAIRDKHYKVLDVNDNGFTIEALSYSKIPLVVKYINTTTNETGEITIQLRGVL